jgi:hypothetical protein
LIPFGEAFAPRRGDDPGVLVWATPTASGLAFVDPRPKILFGEIGKRQKQVAEIAFGVDGDRRDSVDCGLLEKRDAKAGLPASGHADADSVRGQVPRVVEDRLGEDATLAERIALSEVEVAELF